MHSGSIVPHTDHRQQTPDFWVTGLLQLMQNMDELGVRRLPRALGCTAQSCPSLIRFIGISRCTKACKLKNLLWGKASGVFPLKRAVSLNVAARELAWENICRNGMQKWCKCSQIEYIYRCKRLGFFRLAKQFGMRTVTLCGFIASCIIGP